MDIHEEFGADEPLPFDEPLPTSAGAGGLGSSYAGSDSEDELDALLADMEALSDPEDEDVRARELEAQTKGGEGKATGEEAGEKSSAVRPADEKSSAPGAKESSARSAASSETPAVPGPGFSASRPAPKRGILKPGGGKGSGAGSNGIKRGFLLGDPAQASHQGAKAEIGALHAAAANGALAAPASARPPPRTTVSVGDVVERPVAPPLSEARGRTGDAPRSRFKVRKSTAESSGETKPEIEEAAHGRSGSAQGSSPHNLAVSSSSSAAAFSALAASSSVASPSPIALLDPLSAPVRERAVQGERRSIPVVREPTPLFPALAARSTTRVAGSELEPPQPAPAPPKRVSKFRKARAEAQR